MKKIQALLLAGALALTLAACGSSGGDSSAGGDTAGYTVDVAELDPTVYPDDYPLIASGDFEADFEKLKAANLAAELNDYQDVADIFGVDGAYYKNNDFDASGEVYKYYGWYAEDGVSVLITFKANGNKLEYFAYTGNGIS